jgi:hypothetical protein
MGKEVTVAIHHMLAAPKLTVFPSFYHFFYDMSFWMNTVG